MKKTSEYTYTFATGEQITLSVGPDGDISEDWLNELRKLDKKELANDKKETRRHVSFYVINPDEQYMKTMKDGFQEVFAKEAWDDMKTCLTEREQWIAVKAFIEGVPINEVARKLRLSLGHTYSIIRGIQKKLEKFLK